MIAKRRGTYGNPPPAPKRRKLDNPKPPRKPYGKGYQPLRDTDSNTPELKWYDLGTDYVALANGPTTTNPSYTIIPSLNPIVAGDEAFHRNGNKINIKKVTVRVKVAVDPNSNATNANIVASAHTFRVLLIADAYPNGQSLAWDEIFENNPAGVSQQYVYNKLSSTGRFKILMDKFVTVPPSYVSYDGTNFHAYGNHKFFKKTCNIDIATRFRDTNNGTTSIEKNNLFMVITSDASSTAWTQMRYALRTRVRFSDY